jgi:hypothetical protein
MSDNLREWVYNFARMDQDMECSYIFCTLAHNFHTSRQDRLSLNRCTESGAALQAVMYNDYTFPRDRRFIMNLYEFLSCYLPDFEHNPINVGVNYPNHSLQKIIVFDNIIWNTLPSPYLESINANL